MSCNTYLEELKAANMHREGVKEQQEKRRKREENLGEINIEEKGFLGAGNMNSVFPYFLCHPLLHLSLVLEIEEISLIHGGWVFNFTF